MKRFLSRFKYAIVAVVILLIAVVIAVSAPKINNSVSKITDDVVDKVKQTSESGELKVHYFDVGQGDCEFIELPNGETILIDAGERDQGEKVVDKIKGLGYSTINYVIATHPHSDHIGGLIDVYNALNVESTYMPNCAHTTKTYDEFLTCVENEGCKVVETYSGVEMINKDDIYGYFVAPNSDSYEKINNYSACLMLKYGENSFLFMGDAEQESEYEIPGDLTCDVIKVGHHGSRTSSSYNFVTRTHAKYAVIEVGKDNDYSHPHESTLNTWKENGTVVFRTDLNGDILFVSNGKNITYKNQYAFKDKDSVVKNETPVEQDDTPATSQKETAGNETTTTYSSTSEYKWVVNTYRKKIHKPTCESVQKMSPQNKKYTNKSLAELKKEGYSPCGNCHPSE